MMFLDRAERRLRSGECALRHLLGMTLLALFGCAASPRYTPVPAAPRTSQPFVYSTDRKPREAANCVMQAIAERYGVLHATMKDDAAEHREVRLSSRGEVVALVEIDPENVGAHLVIWIPDNSRRTERMALELIRHC